MANRTTKVYVYHSLFKGILISKYNNWIYVQKSEVLERNSHILLLDCIFYQISV